jgi:sigma-B regulation protein RsbU (phosphoserine phosphatase)
MEAHRAGESEEVLIVDDTPLFLQLLSQILIEHGYRVRAVTSGAQALESARTSPPNLILLDIRMPELDGFAVCEQLKEWPATRDVPVIFISALDDVQDKVKAFRTGGVDYITKPFQIDEVLARVETHLALRKLQQQLLDANRRYERELELAGQVQHSFLPHSIPDIPGWEIAARLVPSRETSGDFYDLIPLPEGWWGIVIGDVADKGAGAALFMALSWSLIRTYLAIYPSQPARAMEAVNRRILQDTLSEQFVTAFVGVLDPLAGVLEYGSAGHCPALLVREGGEVQQLERTGMVLGARQDEKWEQQRFSIDVGDLLVVYTDGVTEARNRQGELFREARLQRTVEGGRRQGAAGVVNQILADVNAFAEREQLEDDIALLVLERVTSLLPG